MPIFYATYKTGFLELETLLKAVILTERNARVRRGWKTLPFIYFSVNPMVLPTVPMDPSNGVHLYTGTTAKVDF